MAEEIVRLAAEMDVTGARGPVTAAQESERAWSKSTGAMDASTRKVERSMLDLGQTTRKIAGLATSAFTAVSAGITASKANADNLESSMVSIGAALTASFLAGGPIGLGIGIIGVGIGVLAGRTTDAEEAAKRAAAEHKIWLQGATADAKAAAASVDQLTKANAASIEALANRALDPEKVLPGSQRDIVGEQIREATRDLARMLEIGAKAETIRSAQEKVQVLVRLANDLATAQAGAFSQSVLARIVGSVEEADRLTNVAGEAQRLLGLIDDLRLPEGALPLVDIPQEALDRIAEARENLEDLRRLALGKARIEIDAPRIESEQKIEGIRARITGQATDELALQQEIARLVGEKAVLLQTGSTLASGEIRQLSRLIDLRTAELEATREVNRELKARDQLAGDNALRNEIELLGARNAREREVVRIYQAQRQALEAGRDPALVAERVRLQLAALDAQTVVDPFLQGLTTTLGGGLTEIVMDGITTGFERSSDIALDIVNSLLRQILASIVQSGIAELMGSVLGGAGGGGGGIGGIISTVVGAVGGGGGGTFSGGGSVSTVVSAVGGGAPAAPC